MDIKIFIGLDLSFNSSGITLIEVIDENAQTIEFNRMVYNPNYKELKPLSTINQYSYTLPHNMDYKRLTVIDNLVDLDLNISHEHFDDFDDKDIEDSLMIERYNIDQLYITTKLMVNAKYINELVDKFIDSVKLKHNITDEDLTLIFNIEGNILGGEQSSNQMRVTGGLIMLNQELRHSIIRRNIDKSYKEIKLFITSPTELKMYFTDNGKAEKIDMINTFINKWSGDKLIPETDRIYEINDVVDSFALAVHAYEKYYHTTNFMMWLKRRSPNRVKVKKRKPRKQKQTLMIESKPNIDLQNLSKFLSNASV